MYIITDKDGIVKCMASEQGNLFVRNNYDDSDEPSIKFDDPDFATTIEKNDYIVVYTEAAGTVGDKYDHSTAEWESKPENYPKRSVPEMAEEAARVLNILNAMEEVEKKTGVAILSKQTYKKQYDELIRNLSGQ
jgi:hypothetical protein